MKIKLTELINKFGGTLVGVDVVIENIAPTDMADKNSITFLSDVKYKAQLSDKIGAIIVKNSEDISGLNIPCIETDNPYYYFTQVSRMFNPQKTLAYVISDSAKIEMSTILADDIAIGHNVVIGKNCHIASRVQIYPNVVIGDNVSIAAGTIIYQNVSIYDKVTIGSNCIFHAGCVIGSDGFGNAANANKHWLKIPQVGGVVIGNDVEVGANTTIDCGTFKPTIIGNGVRIDNLVQLAHNVEVCDHAAIAACVGIAGGTKIGKYCQIAGGAGITGHITIADHTVVGGASNVSKDITVPDLYSSALTAMPYKEWARVVVGLRNLEANNKKLRELEKEIKSMKEVK